MALFVIALVLFLVSGEASASIEDHCTDITYYDLIKYETSTKQCCDTKLHQVCTNKSDQICQDVLELQCEVVAWGECISTPTNTPGTKCSVKFNEFAHQNCEELTASVAHTKKVPECKKITKNNCVTDWEVDSNGNKVWAGTETCTPVTWEECEIVEKTVEFPTVKTQCDVDSHIKWAEFVDITTNIVGLESKCEVKKAVNCKNVKTNKCAPVVWQECKMEPREECLAKVIHTPSQEKIHQKKCLTGGPNPETPGVPDVPVNVIYPEKKALVDPELFKSLNGEYSSGMQPNGNFAITNSDGVIIWSTNTVGVGLYFEFGIDGTLEVRDQFGGIYWSAGPFGKEVAQLVLENTGFLVLYSVDGAILWTTQPHKLLRGQTLQGGYSMVSTNGVYTLTMQLDGDLVLSSTHVTWASWTLRPGAGSYLHFHSDGNLVLHGGDDVALWDSGTSGAKAKALLLQEDGQLVLCCNEDGGEVWIGVGTFVREGSYQYLDGKGKNDTDYIQIKKDGENYKWTNKAGQTWTLYPTAEFNVLRVGEDSPYYANDNHRTAVFNSAGVSGPFGYLFVFKGVKAGCPFVQLDISTANEINNNLISGVRVTLSQGGKVVEQLTTDKSAKGQFNSPHGEVVLTAEHSGFTMAPVQLTMGAEECEKIVQLSLSPA